MHEAFMHFFFPELSELIDFTKGVRFLDKEFQKLFADWEKKGWTAGDKLMEYHLKEGGKQLVLVHAEAHGGDQANFKEQQFIRFYRIRDNYPSKLLTQLVIYTGKTVPPAPANYHYQFYGTENFHRFNTFIVNEQQRHSLEELSRANPFALVVLAALEHIDTLDDSEWRRKTKTRLIRLCLDSPFRNLIGDLLIFVQFTIALPEKEETLYRKEIEEILNLPIMGMRDIQPEATKTLEIMLWGKTLEEKEIEIEERIKKRMNENMEQQVEQKNVEIILKLFKSGLEPERIANILEVDSSFVSQVIKGNEALSGQTSTRKKPNSKGSGK